MYLGQGEPCLGPPVQVVHSLGVLDRLPAEVERFTEVAPVSRDPRLDGEPTAVDALTGAADMADPLFRLVPAAGIAADPRDLRRGVDRAQQLLTELRATPKADASMLAVALRELRNLG